jgi:hypothetical protein
MEEEGAARPRVEEGDVAASV